MPSCGQYIRQQHQKDNAIADEIGNKYVPNAKLGVIKPRDQLGSDSPNPRANQEKEEVKPNGKSDKSQFYGSKTPRAILVTKVGKGDCHKGICGDNKDEHCHQVAPIGIPQ